MKIKTGYILSAAILLRIGLGLLAPLLGAGDHLITLRQTSFDKLPNWNTASLKQSFTTFQVSCKAFVKQDPETPVGTGFIDLKAKDWHGVCQAALRVHNITETEAKSFFQKWFTPYALTKPLSRSVQGLFTGYFSLQMKGSTTKTDYYAVPIYSLPTNLVTMELGQFAPDCSTHKVVGRMQGTKVVPYYSRGEINNGALKNTAKVLVWVHSRVDRLFLEIEGSGSVELTNGKSISIGYDGENGAPYTALASVLIKKGVMTKNNASMQHIRHYLDSHPAEMDEVLDQNKSFVFFKILSKGAAYGAQGVTLTSGYSLAVDKKWIPYGLPIWLNTTHPDKKADDKIAFNRLMIAQDTGGAIRGAVRGDVYWGFGDRATFIAGHMKNHGIYWLLLPRKIPG